MVKPKQDELRSEDSLEDSVAQPKYPMWQRVTVVGVGDDDKLGLFEGIVRSSLKGEDDEAFVYDIKFDQDNNLEGPFNESDINAAR